MLVLVRHGETEANAAGVLLGRAESDLTARGYQQAQAVATALAGDMGACLPVAAALAGEVGAPPPAADALDGDHVGRPPRARPLVGAQAARPLPCPESCNVVRVVSSPLGRARQTAAVVAEACGVDQVEIDDRWVELDYGDLDGLAIDQVPAHTWARWRRDPGFVPAGGESLSALGRRVGAALGELAGGSGSGKAVAGAGSKGAGAGGGRNDAAAAGAASGGAGAGGGTGGMLSSAKHVVVVSHVSPMKAAVAWTLGVSDTVAWRLWLAPGSVTVVGWSGGGPSLRAFNLRLGTPLPY